MSVTSSTQNKINKRNSKSKKSSRLQKLSLNGAGDTSSSIEYIHLKNEQIQKSISHLAQAFANGFFTEVNCKILSEDLLDQLAYQVYQFVQKQGELNNSVTFNSFVNESILHKYVNKISIGDFDENSIQKKEINSMNIILYKTKLDLPFIHQINNEDEKQTLGSRWLLPHIQFESLWETLEFDLPFKSQLMQYVFTVIRFDKANIDRNVIHCNQTVLLYGPPGKNLYLN